MVNNASIKGEWAILQNCHLFPSWMRNLAEIVQNFRSKGQYS